MGQCGRALVVRFHLQAITIVIAAHGKTPGAIFIQLGDNFRETMICCHPHGMCLVLNDRGDARAKESRLHIQQLDTLALLVISNDTRTGTLPDDTS